MIGLCELSKSQTAASPSLWDHLPLASKRYQWASGPPEGQRWTNSFIYKLGVSFNWLLTSKNIYKWSNPKRRGDETTISPSTTVETWICKRGYHLLIKYQYIYWLSTVHVKEKEKTFFYFHLALFLLCIVFLVVVFVALFVLLLFRFCFFKAKFRFVFFVRWTVWLTTWASCLYKRKTKAFIGFRGNIIKSIRFNAEFLAIRPLVTLRISFRLL